MGAVHKVSELILLARTQGYADFESAVFFLFQGCFCLAPIIEVSYKVEAIMSCCLLGANHEGNCTEASVPGIFLLDHIDPPVEAAH